MGKLLVPFKKFLSNKNTITILGVLLGIVVLYFGYTWRVNQSISPTQVPYANKKLIAGTKITEADISYTDIPKDFKKNMKNIVTDASKIKGMLVSYDTNIPANSFFFSEALMTEDEMPNSVYSKIDDGYTIVYLEVDNNKTHGSSIFPNDTIDLYMSTKADEDDKKLLYGRFIKQIQVLGVRDNNGLDVYRDRENPGTPAVLLFAVSEENFLLLKKAIALGIEIEPVPRNAAYSHKENASEIANEELKNIILSRTHKIAGECTDLTKCDS